MAEAMLEARRDRIQAGSPAADLAALVALGDSNVRLPASPLLLAGRWVWLAAGVLVLCAIAAVLVVRRRRLPPGPDS